MEENENEFHIQEYECGQKTNLYRMDSHQQDCTNLSTTKKKSNTSLSHLFRAFFYPDNYPLGNYSKFIHYFFEIFFL
jgi:hypothetical protein